MLERLGETGEADGTGADGRRQELGAKRRIRNSGRRWSRSDKWRIVEESYQPGTSVSLVARRYDVNANQVFNWRRDAREGRLGKPPAGIAGRGEMELIALGVIGVDDGETRPMVPGPTTPALANLPARARAENDASAVDPGAIEIALPDGVRVRVGSCVDEQTLRRVLAALQGA